MRVDNGQRPRLLWTLEGAAERLSVSAKTVRRLIGRGQLTPIRIGADLRIAESELERFVAAEYAALGADRKKIRALVADTPRKEVAAV